jgi:transcriptional regulator with XRE-family HTH domain
LEQEIGKKIGAVRRAKGLTLEELGKRTGLSASFLSQVERGLCSISLTSLHKIATELGIQLGHLFPQEPSNRFTTRKGDRKEIKIDSSIIAYEHLSGDFPSRILDAYLVTVMPGDHGDGELAWRHQGEEICYMLQGILHMDLDGQEYALAAGSSLHFPSHLPHMWHNRTQEPALLVVVTTHRII